jgi:transcriptional antiterminator
MKKTQTTKERRNGMNSKLLRSFMVLNNDTNKSLADFLGISETSVSNKINEVGTEFKQGEISLIKSRYKLSPEDVEAIFFS